MFKTILEVAYKNAFLRKSRAILLILMIGLSMGVMVGLEGLYNGMYVHMIDKSMRSDSGEIALYAKQYRLENDIKYRIENAETKVERLAKLSGVDFVLRRLQVEGLAQTATKSNPAKVIGIDLKDEEKFGKFSDFLKSGELNFGKNGIFVGSELAKNLKIKIGSKVIFTTQDSNLEIASLALRVKAIIQTSNIGLDERGIYLPRDRVANLLGVDPNSATQIAIRSDSEEIGLLQEQIKGLFPTLEVYTFMELYPQLKQMQSMMDIFNAITFTIVMIVVFIGILGVMYVSILDRIREFGILLSIGYGYRYIRIQIISEAFFLGFAGYLLGSLIGFLLLSYMKIYGLDLSMFAEGMESFGMSSTLYATIESTYFVSTFFAIMIASVLSVIPPLRKIKKLNPVEVIRDAG